MNRTRPYPTLALTEPYPLTVYGETRLRFVDGDIIGNEDFSVDQAKVEGGTTLILEKGALPGKGEVSEWV